MTHAKNAMHLTLESYLTLCTHISPGTLVLIRLHKKEGLLDIKLNCIKDRKVCVDENKLLTCERMKTKDLAR